jgi:lysophospholipid acyltransferase (LPLAT)-like uncharacterized protein
VKINRLPARFLVGFGYWLLQLWSRTLRFELEDHAGAATAPLTMRYIGALWHNRLLLLPYAVKKFAPQRTGGAALISASRDGDMLAALVQRFGFEVVRGSSSRHGASAMLQLTELMARGNDVMITPDGPRGPAYQLGAGIVFLAQKTGAPVLPVSMEYSSYWRLNNWDRFILPKPFSTVRVITGLPLYVPSTLDDEAFERERLRLQNAMMEIVEMR